MKRTKFEQFKSLVFEDHVTAPTVAAVRKEAEAGIEGVKLLHQDATAMEEHIAAALIKMPCWVDGMRIDTGDRNGHLGDAAGGFWGTGNRYQLIANAIASPVRIGSDGAMSRTYVTLFTHLEAAILEARRLLGRLCHAVGAYSGGRFFHHQHLLPGVSEQHRAAA